MPVRANPWSQEPVVQTSTDVTIEGVTVQHQTSQNGGHRIVAPEGTGEWVSVKAMALAPANPPFEFYASAPLQTRLLDSGVPAVVIAIVPPGFPE